MELQWPLSWTKWVFEGGSMVKTVLSCACASLLAVSAFATISADETKRLSESGRILQELRAAPDKGIPEELWTKAACVIVIPSMKKAAFVVGGEYGSGVMSCRSANQWSAPVFMQLAKGSWGLQIGAQAVDLVLLVMNREGVDKLLEDKISLGADASVAAGPVGRNANASTDGKLNAEMLAYSRAKGAFAGIDLSGGVLRPDKDADARVYGDRVTARQIVEVAGHVTAPAAARPFINALRREVAATTGRRP
jgi:SH3 domain-containing YSC84-like protein 1